MCVMLSVCFRYRTLDKLLHVGACNQTNEIELHHTKKKLRFIRNLMPKIDDNFRNKNSNTTMNPCTTHTHNK